MKKNRVLYGQDKKWETPLQNLMKYYLLPNGQLYRIYKTSAEFVPYHHDSELGTDVSARGGYCLDKKVNSELVKRVYSLWQCCGFFESEEVALDCIRLANRTSIGKFVLVSQEDAEKINPPTTSMEKTVL